MIDREARDKAAEVLRHFISGQITNFEFENKMPPSKDPVILAIEDSMWCFYDDIQRHKMKGKWKLPNDTKEIMSRWIIFLHTEEQYQWPDTRFAGVRPLKHGWLSNLLGKPKKEQEFMQSGSYSVWPFINMESYNNALQNPMLLSGS